MSENRISLYSVDYISVDYIKNRCILYLLSSVNYRVILSVVYTFLLLPVFVIVP